MSQVPPPPRPDPVTLDQIYEQLTSPVAPLDSKAYHLVALNTVAFHPSVKLFLYEDPSATTTTTDSSTEAAVRGRLRRERVLKNVAFMLAQRNNAIAQECRWETVSLLGELCRVEGAHAGAAPTGPPPTSSGAAATAVSLEAKLDYYARENLFFLAQLPWFLPSMNSIIERGRGVEEEPKDGTTGKANGSSAEVRAALKRKLRAAREAARGGANERGPLGTGDGEEEDEDVVIALMDIRRALPTCHRVGGGEDSNATAAQLEWTDANIEHARDLMFVDASTALLHLVPAVSRTCSDVCAQCHRRPTGSSTAEGGAATPTPALLRCSSCKAVYYCSPECQKAHWVTAHRTPCRAYKERCDATLKQYYEANNAHATKKKKAKDRKTGDVVILEVPLEPSLFFETRRYLYDHRDESFANVNFADYFMKYTVRGS